MDMSDVILNPKEMYHSGLVGYRRNLEAIVRHRKPRFPEKVSGELFGYHIIGAMAELAVAKCLNLYWGFHEEKFSPGDVNKYEVRYSQMKSLKIRERDTGVVVCVSGYPPNFNVIGWINADEGKNKKWEKTFRDGPPAYFVPHIHLNDMEELCRA
jgi:hypothetical protein